MQQMTNAEMGTVSGGDFWTGVQCGMGIVGLTIMPELAPLAVGAVTVVCAKALSN
jgi:hypothetical protein